MARIYYKNAHSKKQGYTVPGPLKTTWKGLLVQDDIIHIGVSKAADGLHRISPRLTRKTLAFGTIVAGIAVDSAMNPPNDLKELGWKLLGGGFLLGVGKMMSDWKMDSDNNPNKFSEGIIDKFLRIARMPIVAIGAFEIAVAGLAFKFPGIETYKKLAVLGDGIVCTAMGTACYLISSSTGAYNDFKNWAWDLSERIDEKLDD